MVDYLLTKRSLIDDVYPLSPAKPSSLPVRALCIGFARIPLVWQCRDESASLLSWSQAAPLRDACRLAAEAAAMEQQAAAIISLRRAIMFGRIEIMDVCSVFGFTECWERNIFTTCFSMFLIHVYDFMNLKSHNKCLFVWY